jgi:hypothetical protein
MAPQRTHHAVLSAEERAWVRERIEALGEHRAADFIGASRLAIVRVAAGFAVTPGTTSLVRAAMVPRSPPVLVEEPRAAGGGRAR